MKLISDSHFEVAAQHFLNASNLKSTDLHGYDRQMADGLETFVEGTRRALQQILDQLEAQKPKVQAAKVQAAKAPAGKAPVRKGKK